MKKNISKTLWIGLGFFSLGIGAVGAVLPFLPTFPFLMLTLFCFGKSSEKLHTWFMGTKLYKNNLESYVANRSMTVRTKAAIMISVTLVMILGFIMMNRVPVARIVLVFVWLFHVIYFVFRVKTLKAGEGRGERVNG